MSPFSSKVVYSVLLCLIISSTITSHSAATPSLLISMSKQIHNPTRMKHCRDPKPLHMQNNPHYLPGRKLVPAYLRGQTRYRGHMLTRISMLLALAFTQGLNVDTWSEIKHLSNLTEQLKRIKQPEDMVQMNKLTSEQKPLQHNTCT
jgi:hypothetical protein